MRKLWKKRSMMAILTAAMLMNEPTAMGMVVHASEPVMQNDMESDNKSVQQNGKVKSIQAGAEQPEGTDSADKAEDVKGGSDSVEQPEDTKEDNAGLPEDTKGNCSANPEDSDEQPEGVAGDSTGIPEGTTEGSTDEPEDVAEDSTDKEEESAEDTEKEGTNQTEKDRQNKTEQTKINDADRKPELVHQTLSQTKHGVTVMVSGCMPKDAELHVVESSYEEKGISYEISIQCEDGEYIPEEYGEKLKVSFEFVSQRRDAEAKIYTVFAQEKEEQEQLATAEQGEKAVFETERLSRYVIVEEVNYGGTTQWDYDYSGNSQNFVAPVTGVYRFDLYGAQGSAYQEHQGGKGGMVSVELELSKDEEIELIIGGTDGYHGGGKGRLSNGGGATSLLVDGTTAAVAGGGGGATNLMDGGEGGDSQGEWSSSETGDSSQVSYSAGGGGGYLGGKSGYTQYHVHTGSSNNGGGCFTSAVKHEHTSGCWNMCGTYRGYGIDASKPNYVYAKCDRCGTLGYRVGDLSDSFVRDESWKHVLLVCNKNSNTIDYYNPGCGKQSTTVEKKLKAYGGSSYYDTSVCRSGIMNAGVQEGSGKVLVNLLELDGATLSYYNYDMSLLGSITVEKGGAAGYPLTDIPVRAEDNKYSYEFTGWDNMQTSQQETMSSDDTVNTEVTEDRNYVAVYRSIPKEYTITLENGEGASTVTQTVKAVYGQEMPEIELPEKEGYLFAGYYTLPDGTGTQYYTPKGDSEHASDITQNTTLYAYWVQPLAITAQPEGMSLYRGYRDAVMETDYVMSLTEGYTVDLQWYIGSGTPEPIANAKSKKLTVPNGYSCGTYEVWCELKVTSDHNGQKITLLTDKAEIVVMKGILLDKDVMCATPKVTYDEKPHSVKVKADAMSDAVIYYGEKPLNADNYNKLGKTGAYSYTNAGSYQIYVYITGEDYQDYAGHINMEIMKAQRIIDAKNYPVIRKNGTVMFPKDETWEYYKDGQEVTEYGQYKGEQLEKGDYVFRIAEDENHYASEEIRLKINPVQENSGQDNPDDNDQTGGTTEDSETDSENSTETENGSGDSTGTGTGSGDSTGTGTGSGDSTGTGTGSGDNAGTGIVSGDSAGTGTGSGNSTETETGSGDSAGTGTGSGNSAGTENGNENNAGTGTESGNSAETGTVSGDSAGTGTGSGDNAGTGTGSGDNAGTGTGNENNAGTVFRTGNSTGTATRTVGLNGGRQISSQKANLDIHDYEAAGKERNNESTNAVNEAHAGSHKGFLEKLQSGIRERTGIIILAFLLIPLLVFLIHRRYAVSNEEEKCYYNRK